MRHALQIVSPKIQGVGVLPHFIAKLRIDGSRGNGPTLGGPSPEVACCSLRCFDARFSGQFHTRVYTRPVEWFHPKAWVALTLSCASRSAEDPSDTEKCEILQIRRMIAGRLPRDLSVTLRAPPHGTAGHA